MLVPLTRQTFEELIPAVATAAQYKYAWGKPSDFLKRLLISVVSVLFMLLVYKLAWEDGGAVVLIFGLIAGLYWLWGPVLSASLRNLQCRKYKYCGFWQGRVLDVYITEEVSSQEETVNSKGQLVIVDNLERMINVEVGDKTEFTTKIKTLINRTHQEIAPGQVALMLVMSNEEDLSRISKVSDIYIPSRNIWVSDYPYLRRDVFVEVSRQLKKRKDQRGRDESEERGGERMRSRLDY
ncbi:phosphate ABC transporter permease [Kamptonema animale CS-326]|jgi:hypothetical protein|uniref:phosphate ABC transporter permease n=1 Tax=Kamptonema animale TaxID=92934 RepID=UPI00232A8EAA|nr:phosphate ABC transporter permease [Kamptonema animale]MDB9515006.1 phosphate ABC transporter permease [Kamptonema animale CS-326]